MLAHRQVACDFKTRLQRRNAFQCIAVSFLICAAFMVYGAVHEDKWSSTPHCTHGLQYNCSSTFDYSHRRQATFRHCRSIDLEYRGALAEVRSCLNVAAVCVTLAIFSLREYFMQNPPKIARMFTHLFVASTGVSTMTAAHTYACAFAGEEYRISFQYTVLAGMSSLLSLCFFVLRTAINIPDLCERVLPFQDAPEKMTGHKG